MKAKRLTALALAALMAASTTSVALAGERVDADLDFANDGYYKYNSDTNRLESAKEMNSSLAMMYTSVLSKIRAILSLTRRLTMPMLTGLSATAG